MKFETTNELIEQAEKDGACKEAIDWCRGKEFQEILKTLPYGYRCWCLMHGYKQFSKYYWESMNGSHWSFLLQLEPLFADYCDQAQLINWDKLSGWNWACLLREQPQLEGYCDWSKLSGAEWSFLLGRRPQFASYCSWDKLSEFDWLYLLEYQPQLAKYREQLNEV